MRKVFWDDPYQTLLKTQITNVNENWLEFAKTIAYSFSGGQESDNAFINTQPIIDSKILGHTIIYQVAENHTFYTGQYVQMEIDWTRRFQLMRLHFAVELVLEFTNQILNIPKIKAHIAQNKARIDFLYQRNITHIFEQLLFQYDLIIDQNLSIKKGFIDEKAQKRYWEIKGFSKVPCGGPHVNTTSEVGAICLKRKNIGKGKERIEINLSNS